MQNTKKSMVLVLAVAVLFMGSQAAFATPEANAHGKGKHAPHHGHVPGKHKGKVEGKKAAETAAVPTAAPTTTGQ